MSNWTIVCKWRGKDFKTQMPKVSRIKELKTEISKHFGLDNATLKLMIKGSSNLNDFTRICDISGSSSPLAVNVISGNLINVNNDQLDKQKYEKEVEAIQEALKVAAAENVLRSSVIPDPSPFHPIPSTSTMNDVHEDNYMGRNVFNPTGKVEAEMQIFSSAFLSSGNPPSDESNQVVLPVSYLKAFTDQSVEFPIFIELTRYHSQDKSVSKTCVTPANYDNKINAIYAPYQVLLDLNIFEGQDNNLPDSSDVQDKTTTLSTQIPKSGEGSLVSFKTVKLPNGTSATLQPLNFAWITNVPEEQQKAVLENQLRRYQCLSLNETIQIKHQNQPFKFKVVELAPADHVSLLSSDLAVNILPPMDAPQHVDLRHELSKNGSTTTGETRQTSSIVSLVKGQSQFYELEISDPNDALLIEIEPIEGYPPAVYICTRRQYPTSADHTWSSEDTHFLTERQIRKLQQTGKKRILLSQDDPDFKVGSFFIGINSALADSKVKLTVSVGSKSRIATGSSFFLGSVHSNSNLSTDGPSSSGILNSSGDLPVAPPENTVLCDNCSRFVPKPTFVMHSAQCSRRNWKCPQCQLVCPVEEKEKHISISHSKVQCECGFESEGELVALHKQFECDLRPFECPYCKLAMPMKQRASHMSDCGARTSQCQECNQWIKNYNMAMHMMESHPHPDAANQMEE